MSKRLVPLVLSAFLLGPLWAEDPVHFADENLKAAVEGELWISDPTATDMLGLTFLNASYKGITSPVGLEYAANLESLDLSQNRISDISALSGLSKLATLVLNNNTITDISPLSGLTNLRELDIHDNGVSDVSALSRLTNLQSLILRRNMIRDISALSGLTHLRHLDLHQCRRIADLSPLSAMAELDTLILRYNDVSNLSPLSGLASLRVADLRDNQIEDVSPLTALSTLDELDLRMNPLNERACDIYLPQIQLNNPGMTLRHDRCGPRRVTVSSTAGGSVTWPGVGEFLYDNAEYIRLEARADPCFMFARWSGTYPSQSNPAWITISDDAEIRANFLSVFTLLYVDDDAPGDPGPGDALESDPKENGSADHPFDTIQEAIDVAPRNATILVHPGTYRENIDFLGKRIRVTGIDRANPYALYPIIEGVGPGPVVRFAKSEDASCTLTGFVIVGSPDRSDAAILCSASSPTIANCLIAGHRSTEPCTAAVSCTDSNAVFINCTIADNYYAATDGAGLSLRNSHVTVINSILWGNVPREIALTGEATASIRYSAVAGGWPGQGNLSSDPLFAGPGCWVDPRDPGIVMGPNHPEAVWVSGDYHLKSRAGRWDPETGSSCDAVTSPCIDAGDPEISVGREPSPNGGVINLGAYGGTATASKSPSHGP
jgi:hypothetical protein